MIVEKNIQEIRDVIKKWRTDGLTVCLVPTMGYFHEGHLALMKKGHDVADKVVVSLFVNPTQFGPDEDLDNYPRDLSGDFEKAQQASVDMVFCPNTENMYPEGHKTYVTVTELSEGLCGKDRPVHFTGVTTIVTKLLNIVQPHYVVFGEKDFQQLTIIQRMVSDLDIPVEVIGYPVVREADGLAMSSRNAYLDDDERAIAVCLYTALCEAKRLLRDGDEKNIDKALKTARNIILHHKQCTIDYFTLVDSETLEKKNIISGNCRLVGAVKINAKVRLIDNIPL